MGGGCSDGSKRTVTRMLRACYEKNCLRLKKDIETWDNGAEECDVIIYKLDCCRVAYYGMQQGQKQVRVASACDAGNK